MIVDSSLLAAVDCPRSVFLALLIPSIDLALRRGVLRAGFAELDSSGKAQRPRQRSQTWVDDGPTADDALRHELNSAFSARIFRACGRCSIDRDAACCCAATGFAPR
jgi:hypothetical protein